MGKREEVISLDTTIEELEIVIKARIDNALSDIKQITDTVKSEVKESASSMNSLKESTSELSKAMQPVVAQAKKQMQTYKNTVSKAQSEVIKQLSEKATAVLDFDIGELDANALEKKMEELVGTRDSLFGDENTLVDESLSDHLSDLVFKILEVKEAIETVNSTKLSIEENPFETLGNTSTSPNVSANVSDNTVVASEPLEIDLTDSLAEITTLQQAWQNVFNEIKRQIPAIENLSINVGNWIEESPLLAKISEVKARVESSLATVRTNTQNWIDTSPLLNKINEITTNIGAKTSEWGAKFGNIGNTLAIPFDMIRQRASGLSNLFQPAENSAKGLSNALNPIKKQLSDIKKRSSDTFKGLNKSLNAGIKSIKKFVTGLLGVRTAFSAISKAAQAYLSFDTELSNSFQNSWNVLGSLLAPALELVASLFSKLVSYVAAFVKALTGIDLVAKANAKALENQADAASNASKQLSGIDDINTLSSSTSSETTTITVEDIDLGNLDYIFDWIEEAKDVLSTIFDPFVQAWNSKGEAVVSSIKNAFNGIKNTGVSVFSSILEVWNNGTGQTIIENWLERISLFLDIVGNIGNAFSIAWDNAGNGTSIIQSILNIFISIQDVVNSILESLKKWTLSKGFQKALNTVISFIADILGYLEDIASWLASMYAKYVAPVVDKVLDAISSIVVAIGTIWDFIQPVVNQIIQTIQNVLEPVIEGLCGFIGGIVDAIKGVAEFITAVFTGDWEAAWEAIKDILGGIIDAIKSLFTGLFEAIGEVFQGAWDIVVSIWEVVSDWFSENVIEPLKNLFTGIWDGIKQGASDAWEGIKSVFSSVADWFGNIFSNAWQKVKDVFSTGGQIFDGIKEGIVSAFTTIVNAIITGINKVVATPFNAINSILTKVKETSIGSWKPFNFISTISVPQIPTLATGNVATEPTLAMFAEYANAKSDPEITAPQSIIRETLKQALQDYSFTNSNNNQRIVVNFGAKNIVDEIIDEINRRISRRGVSVFKEG